MNLARCACLVAIAACGFRNGAVIGGDASRGGDAASAHDATLRIDAPPVTLSGAVYT
jgi:hypothetical protein